MAIDLLRGPVHDARWTRLPRLEVRVTPDGRSWECVDTVWAVDRLTVDRRTGRFAIARRPR